MKQSDDFIVCRDFIHAFVRERLEGNIQELINFDFSSLHGDSRYGCNGRSFDCDDTNLMRGISFLLWGESFPDLTLYEIGPGKKYRGDTLNTFNRVFGYIFVIFCDLIKNFFSARMY